MTRRHEPDAMILWGGPQPARFQAYFKGGNRSRTVEDELGQSFFQQRPLDLIYDDAYRGIVLASGVARALSGDQLTIEGEGWRRAPLWTAAAFRLRRWAARQWINLLRGERENRAARKGT